MKLLFIGLLCSLPLLTEARNINIDVSAQWPRYSTSFMLELSEFLFDLRPKLFWDFVDDMCSHSAIIDDVITASRENVLSEKKYDKQHELESVALSSAIKIAYAEMPLPAMGSLMNTMVNFDNIKWITVRLMLQNCHSPFRNLLCWFQTHARCSVCLFMKFLISLLCLFHYSFIYSFSIWSFFFSINSLAYLIFFNRFAPLSISYRFDCMPLYLCDCVLLLQFTKWEMFILWNKIKFSAWYLFVVLKRLEYYFYFWNSDGLASTLINLILIFPYLILSIHTSWICTDLHQFIKTRNKTLLWLLTLWYTHWWLICKNLNFLIFAYIDGLKYLCFYSSNLH